MFKNIKIIGGKWRSRKLHIIHNHKLRPTTNKAKETLFNWLSPPILSGSNCLDGFAGTGALGLEALSRNASGVTFIEINYKAIANLKELKNSFNITNAKIFHINLQTWLKISKDVYDIVFLDPPFQKNLIYPIIKLLQKHNHLKQNSYVYVETEKSNTFLPLSKQWIIHRKKVIGNVLHQLFLFNP